MPQFDPSTFPSQIFWLAVTFIALYFLMSRVVLPRIAEVLEERSERIADDLERAESLRKDAMSVIEKYEAALTKARSEATAMISSTQQEIDETAALRTADFDAELNSKLVQAEQRIARAKHDAMEQVREIAADVTAGISFKLTGERPDSAKVEAEIERQMNEAA